MGFLIFDVEEKSDWIIKYVFSSAKCQLAFPWECGTNGICIFAEQWLAGDAPNRN